VCEQKFPSPFPLLSPVESFAQDWFNASRTAAMNFSSLNGFMKNATGPMAIAVASAKRSPTRPSLTVFALAFSSANHKPLYHAAISPIPLRLCGS
jgi:hypothetical protein